jgi:sterol desaturase/sphingolipid hydroxylase (fatty acid hydroxylase superfamily)
MSEGFVQIYVGAYLALLSIYVGASLFFGWLNRTPFGQARKIQRRTRDKDLPLKSQIRSAAISLAGIAALLAAGVWLNERGYALFPQLALDGYTVVGGFLLSMLVYDTHFYWTHRLVHRPGLMRRVHKLHHDVQVPVPWTTNSESFLDGVLINAYWLYAAVLLPVPVEVLVLHRLYDMFTGVMGHCGHEYAGIFTHRRSPFVSVTHHDQHHQYFHCNFGVHFLFWDRLMGTLRPGYHETASSNAFPEKP